MQHHDDQISGVMWLGVWPSSQKIHCGRWISRLQTASVVLYFTYSVTGSLPLPAFTFCCEEAVTVEQEEQVTRLGDLQHTVEELEAAMEVLIQ